MTGWCEVIMYTMVLKDAVSNQVLGKDGVLCVKKLDFVATLIMISI
jgi:hypothetical protein